jgi:hypothetical protein
VLSGWAELGITWNSQPSAAVTPTAQITVPASPVCVNVDVTPDVLAWTGGQPNYGWRIKDMDEALVAPVQYGTRENLLASVQPKLTIRFK